MIHVDISKCTGCRRCEVACAFFHTGRVNNHMSRIKVLQLYEEGIDGPVVCAQCQERYCMCCPEDALTLGPLGQIVCSPTVCTLCGSCEKACPIGAVEIFDDLVYVCDLCGGNPRCVEACTEGAITFEYEDKERPSLSDIREETGKMKPELKRKHYIHKNGQKLRAEWRKERA